MEESCRPWVAREDRFAVQMVGRRTGLGSQSLGLRLCQAKMNTSIISDSLEALGLARRLAGS